MSDILKDVMLELSEGTKLGKNGFYPTHKDALGQDESRTLKKEDEPAMSDAEKTAHEITEIVHYGGAIE